jgi:hypothetical protein
MPTYTETIPCKYASDTYTAGDSDWIHTEYNTGARFNYVNRPDGRRPKPTGWLYPTNYTFGKVHALPLQGSVNKTINISGNRYFTSHMYGRFDAGTSVVNSLPFPSAVPDSMSNRALIKALLKLQNQKINLGIALGESQRTADLLGSTATRLANAAIAFKRGRWAKAADTLGLSFRKAPRSWLEYQYGWKPLVSDIYGAMNSLAVKNQNPLSRIVTCKGVVADRSGSYEDLILHEDLPYARKGDALRGAFVRLDFEPVDDLLAAFSQLGTTNPFVVAWELTPWSFVVDWMLPIGEYFNVLHATLGYKFKSGSLTHRREARATLKGTTWRGEWFAPNSEFTVSSSVGARGHYLFIERYVYPSLPVPTLRMKNPLSLTHMANGLALLASCRRMPRGNPGLGTHGY